MTDFGNTTGQSSLDNLGEAIIWCGPFTAPSSGTLTSISLYCKVLYNSSGNPRLALALYDATGGSGKPGARLASDEANYVTVSSSTLAFVTQNLSSLAVSITSGTNYWFAARLTNVNTGATDLDFGYTTNGGATEMYYHITPLGTLSFPANAQSGYTGAPPTAATDERVSIYATYTPASTTYPITRSVTQAQSLTLGTSKVFKRTVNASQNQTATVALYLGAHYSLTRSTTQTQSVLLTSASVSLPTDYYTTSFPLTQNPISESGVWTNGKLDGVDWNNIATTTNKEYGTQSGSASPPYDDSVAHLKGTWGNDQEARATVFTTSPAGDYSTEVELLLRFDITAHTARGYEIEFSIYNGSNIYFDIVRWNGPLANATNSNNGFTPLLHVTNPTMPILVTGDVVYAKIVGNPPTISGYVNGTLIGSVTDTGFTPNTPWSSGRPGVGHYLNNRSNTGNPATYGFSQYMAHTIGTAIPVQPRITQGQAVSLTKQVRLVRTLAQPQAISFGQLARLTRVLTEVLGVALVRGAVVLRSGSAVQATLVTLIAKQVLVQSRSIVQATTVARLIQTRLVRSVPVVESLQAGRLVRLSMATSTSTVVTLGITPAGAHTYVLSGTATSHPQVTLSASVPTGALVAVLWDPVRHQFQM